MDSLKHLVVRSSDNVNSSDTIITLMIVFLSLIFILLLLVAALIMLRRVRQRQKKRDSLPQYNEVRRSTNHHRLTIQTPGTSYGNEKSFDRSSVIIFRDGQPMLANPHSPPHSPDNVPEIHITFPDEQDDQGRRKSGRVVVVRVGETSVGLEPLHDEQLPAYEKESNSQFYAVDLEKVGGLKEKEDYF